MDSKEDEKILPYLEALKNAETDNEKFAALLMVAKITQNEKCDIDMKKQILESIGKKFFSRLLKTKTVPDDCPPNIYKSVAISILSALCSQPEMALQPVLKDNMTSCHGIVLLNPSQDDMMSCQLVDDTYQCFSLLCQSSEGIEVMLQEKTVSTLCKAVTSRLYGCQKAQDLLFCIISSVGVRAWYGCEMVFNSVFSHFSQQFKEEQGERKFELCKTLVFLLTTVPREVEDMDKPPWIENIVSGLESILRSKIGAKQKEPSLRLASMLVQACGVESMLPPVTADCKLFLLTAHLCCVEVRMLLEAEDMKQAFSNGHLLSSCYSYLESVINHLTTSSNLHFDERQILQLHSALTGAFSAVVHFLKRVEADATIQWNSVVLATIRILAAWMAEETSALKTEVCDLIPFLVQVSKLCLPISNGESTDEYCHSTEVNAQNDFTSILNTTTSPVQSEDINQTAIAVGDHAQITYNEDESIAKTLGDVKLSNQDSEIRDIGNRILIVNDDCDKLSKDKSLKERKQVTFKDTDGGQSKNLNNSDCKLQTENGLNMKKDYEEVYDVKVLRNIAEDNKAVLSDRELLNLHLRVNIFHFLLPGLCHMTADEIPREILLNCGALGLLDLYMWKQWENFLKMPANREVQSSIVILCNIFLNLTIVEPDVVTKYEEFSHILLLTVKGIQVAESNCIVLWSHLVTLGLMLIRLLHRKTEEILESESVTVFFKSCINYLNSAYTVKHKRKGNIVMDIAELYVPVWDQISQTWFLSMQAFSSCIPLYKELTSVVVQSGWLSTVLKNLLEVKGNGVTEETRSCYLLLLVSVAKESESAKMIIKEQKGIEISMIYKSKELHNILQRPPAVGEQ